jgi:hypothetical protein
MPKKEPKKYTVGVYKLWIDGYKPDDSRAVYVGSSIKIEERLKDHNRQLKAGKHHSYKFQRAYNVLKEKLERRHKADPVKYPETEPRILMEILEVCEPEDFVLFEEIWIRCYVCRSKHGFNVGSTRRSSSNSAC